MSENDELTSFFENLKQIRLDKNISLKTISRDSRIQTVYLEAIEVGDFNKIPAVYDKLFFQTYLSYLNLENSEEYLEKFKLLRKEAATPSHTTTIRRMNAANAKSHPIYNLKTLFIAAPAILIVFILGFMALNTENVDDVSNEKVKELPVRKIVQEYNALQKAKEDSVRKLDDISKKVTNVDVILTITEKTWLRYIKDNTDTTEYMLYAGNEIKIGADSTLHFLVGNAHGVRFKINGIEKGLLGKTGDVISYLKITNKGIVGQRLKSINVQN